MSTLGKHWYPPHVSTEDRGAGQKGPCEAQSCGAGPKLVLRPEPQPEATSWAGREGWPLSAGVSGRLRVRSGGRGTSGLRSRKPAGPGDSGRGVPRAPDRKVGVCVPGPLAMRLRLCTGDSRSGLPTTGRGRANTSGQDVTFHL